MKKFYKRILAFLLAGTLVFPFVSCRSNTDEEQEEGISIEEDAPYSDEALAYAEQTIHTLVLYTYRKMVFDKIPENVEARLAEYAHRLCKITAASPVSEAQYRSVIDLLAQEGQGVIDELVAFRAGRSKQCEKTRALYLELTSVFGADRVASMLYDSCLLIYDARYERTMEKFEAYQYPWYQDEADALLDEKDVFEKSVGKESFSALVRCSIAMAELLSSEPGNISGSFSDAEILEVIRHLDLSEIRVDESGWKLLIPYILKRNDSTTYRAKFCKALQESGDVDQIALVMNSALELLATVTERLVPADIALLREGKREELLSSVFSRFDDRDWELFKFVTSVSFSNETYHGLAIEAYGKAYSEYLASIRQVDFDELRASVGKQEFYQNLSDYLAAICPAISYEVK